MASASGLRISEDHRITQHEAIKDEIRNDVQSEVAQTVAVPALDETQQAAQAGQRLRHQALTEVTTTENELGRARSAARISQVVDFIFTIIYSLIGLEILLDLLGARRGNGIRNIIDTLTLPLLSPFESLMQSIGIGRYQLRLSYLFAIIVYILLHLGINAFLRMFVERKTTI